MTEYDLKAESREVLGKKNKSLRKQGTLPAVLYGSGIETTAIAIPEKEFSLIYKQSGDNSLINLEVSSGDQKKTHSVLVHQVALDPVSSNPLHVDFYKVNMDKPITAHVHLVFIGESLAVKEGGILVKAMDTLEIESLPKDLPHEMTVDLSKLEKFDDTFYVKDLVAASGVKILTDLNNPIATVTAPRSEEELKELEEKVEEKIEEVKVEGEEKRLAKEAEETEAAQDKEKDK